MTIRKLVLFSILTVLLGLGMVCTLQYEFRPSPSLTSTGTLSVSAYYAVEQMNGGYAGSYVQVPVTVTGPESYNGTTTTDGGTPLSFTVAPGEYSIFGVLNKSSLITSANVSTGSSVKILLNFASSVTTILPITAQGMSDGLELQMTLEETVYSLGEPVNVTLTITNISNQTKTLGLSAYNDFDFQVNDTNGTIYQDSDKWLGGAVPDVISYDSLEPGESLSENLVWNQTYPAPAGNFGGPVPQGTYYIVGLIGSVIHVPHSMIETTPIEITITPSNG